MCPGGNRRARTREWLPDRRAGFVLGFLASPKATRLAAGTLSIVALADALQIAYKAAEDG